MSSTFDLKFIRSLSPAMAKVLLVFLFEHGGMTIDELVSKTGLNDRHTLYRACRDLSDPAYGLLAKQTGAHGKDIWMPAGNLLPMVRGTYYASPDGGKPTIWIENQQQKQIQMVEKPPSEREIQAESSSDGGNSTICAGSIRLIDRLIKDNDKESSHAEKFPTLEIILGGLDVVRGMKVGNRCDPSMLWLAPDLASVPAKTPPKLALAWVVKTYVDRARLSNPVGQIVSRLKTYSSRSLPDNWQERLPDEYLQAIGIAPAVKKPEAIHPIPPEPESPPDPPADPDPSPPERPIIFQLYESEIGPITPLTAEFLKDAERLYSSSWIEDAFALAVKNNSRKWNYISVVLDGWQRNGRDWKPQLKNKANANHIGGENKSRKTAVEDRQSQLIEIVRRKKEQEALENGNIH